MDEIRVEDERRFMVVGFGLWVKDEYFPHGHVLRHSQIGTQADVLVMRGLITEVDYDLARLKAVGSDGPYSG